MENVEKILMLVVGKRLGKNARPFGLEPHVLAKRNLLV